MVNISVNNPANYHVGWLEAVDNNLRAFFRNDPGETMSLETLAFQIFERFVLNYAG